MSRPDFDQMTISLGAQLFLTHFAAAGVAVLLVRSLGPAAGLPVVALAAAGVVGVALTLNLPRSLRQLYRMLWRLAQDAPAAAEDGRWHGPLAGLLAQGRAVAARERPFADLRQRQLRQAQESAAIETRKRLARDLHDSIKQQLFSIQVSAAAAEVRWEHDPAGARAALADARGGAQAALVEMNALLRQLAPEPLESVGLVAALREQAEALAHRSGAAVDVAIGVLPAAERLPAGAETALFRIAQEALSNVARHARAGRVRLALGEEDGTLVLTVADDGQGFAVETAVGMGLDGVRQRAAALGGAARVDSAPGRGTTLRVTLPLQAAEQVQQLAEPNPTLNRIVLLGLGGGALLAALLFYPLFVWLPGRYLADWPAGAAWPGWVCAALAALAAGGVGWLAARGTAVSRPGGTGWGALAGGLAGALAFWGVGGAAAAVWGGQRILQHGLTPAASETAFYALLVDGTVGVVMTVFAGWWLLVALAAACGAVGGALAPPRREAPAGVVAPLAEVLPPVLFVGALTSMLALLLTTAGFGLLGPQVAAAAGEHLNWRAGTLLSFRTGTILVDGGQGAGSGLAAGVRYPPMLASVLPLGSALLLTLAFVAGYWRSLQPPARPDGPSRRRAVGSAYALALLGSLLVLGLPEMVMDVALRTVVRVGVAPLLLLCLLLVQTAVRLAARDARETAVGWLLASPLAGLVMAYGLSWAGWNGAALGLVVGLAAAVLLALSQAPPEPAVAPELAQTPLALSRLLPGALALVLPLLLPLAAALGLVFIPVAAIGVLGAYPGGGALPGSAAPLAFQVRSLYAFGALALLVGLLLGLLLMGLSVVAARLRDGRRREG